MRIVFIVFYFFISNTNSFSQQTKQDYIKLAKEYGVKNEYKKSINCFTKIIELNPNDSTAYLERALLKQMIKDYKGAIMDFTKGGKINPSEVDYFFLRGILYQRMKEYSKAIEDYNKTMTMEVNADAYRFRGQIKEINKDYRGALIDYNKAISINRYSEVFKDRGLLKSKLNDSKGALEDIKSAIAIDSLDDTTFYARGKIYLRNKEINKALIDFNKAIELNKSHLYYYLERALLESKLGQKSKACEDFAIFLKLGGKSKHKIICN